MMTTTAHTPSALAAWFAGQIPDGWFSGPVAVQADRDEILVTGDLSDPSVSDDTSPEDRDVARASRISRFREETRDARMAIAARAEAATDTKVSWAVTCGGKEGRREVFTNVSAPVMTRLRMPERAVLDTLVHASVARSRSEALAWCVRLVAQHQHDWIVSLREAMVEVERLRAEGPTA